MEPLFEWRQWRWLALLPDEVAFRAEDEDAWRRLEREAEVLVRLRAAIGPTVPRVVSRNEGTRTQVRERIHGASGREVEAIIFGKDEPLPATERYRETCPLTPRGSRLAADLGRLLARMHGVIALSEAEALGLGENVPRLDERTAEIIRTHARSPLLERALRNATSWLAILPEDRVVVHGDPHLHNLAMDAASGALRGIFDFDETARADRRQDLAYLHSSGLAFARVALRAYADVGPPVDERAVGRFHVICALEHFSFVAPEAERFPHIVEWATAAVLALAPEWARD
jgi:aminoglycoside phosphotransferase (APT) family kinase protein